jgi:heme/copper-type cytochrome/quinol oxidase subunit 2
MSARTIAGWTALVSGALLVLAMLFASTGSAIGAAVTGFPMGPGMMGPGMMGPGMMGPGMMGFGSSGPASSPIPGASEVRVEAFNFGFSPSEVHLPKKADVNLTFSDPTANGVVHDFTVPALGIHVVANPGETRTVGLRGLPAGRYDAYCSVPGHAEAGMRATIVVN